MKNLYPIYLPDFVAETLVTKHAEPEFRNATRYHSGREQYEYSAQVLENGDVKLHVYYSFDDGFAMGGGGLFNKTIRPYTDDQLVEITQREMVRHATSVYEARQKEKRNIEIRAIAEELFKGEFA